MEPYPGGQFALIDDPNCQFGNGSVWTRTQSDGPEPLLTLVEPSGQEAYHQVQLEVYLTAIQRYS
jgi:hypothetical protein